MSNYKSNARMEKVGLHYQATDAVICGEVEMGEDASVWFGAVVRGDVAGIRVGRRTNLQDGCVVHCDEGVPLEIGEDCTVGHGAVIHCKKVGNRVLIGMNAVLLGGCVVGDDCVIGAGAVVSPGTVVANGQVVLGVPGKVVRGVREEEREHIRANGEHYVRLAREHVEGAERMYKMK